MKVNHLLFCLLLSSFSMHLSFSMEEKQEPITFSMTKINKWQDVKPFAGRVIAYTTNSYYFGSHKGYPISTDARLKYGYINDILSNWQGGETGYNLTQLLKPEEIPGNRALINSQLEGVSLWMRLATTDELNKIRKAIESDKAEFEYMFDKKRAYSLLTESEQKLPAFPSLLTLNIHYIVQQLKSGKATLQSLKGTLPAEVYEKVEEEYLRGSEK